MYNRVQLCAAASVYVQPVAGGARRLRPDVRHLHRPGSHLSRKAEQDKGTVSRGSLAG